MGYQQASETLEEALQEVKLEHTLQIKEIEAQIVEANQETLELRTQIDVMNIEIKRFNDGLDGMMQQLEIIDTNIIDSEVVQLEISSYLNELDERLSELQESLKILEAAPNEVD